MSRSSDAGFQPAIVLVTTYKRRELAMRWVYLALAIVLGGGAVWTVLTSAPGATFHYRGSEIPPWLVVVVGAAAIAGSAWYLIAGLKSANEDNMLVGWRAIQGGVELVGMTHLSRNTRLAIPTGALVLIEPRETRRTNRGTVTLYGVAVWWQQAGALFDVDLMPKGIDVGPLVALLGRMGNPVQVHPDLHGASTGNAPITPPRQPMPQATLQAQPLPQTQPPAITTWEPH